MIISSFSVQWKNQRRCCCSVAKYCLTLCDPMDWSTPGFPVLHHLPEFAQIHDHWVGDTFQTPHPLLLPSYPALSLSQHQSLLQWVSYLHQVVSIGTSASASVLPVNIQCWFPLGFPLARIDFLAFQGTFKSLLQHHNSKALNSSVLNFLYGPTLTSVHEYRYWVLMYYVKPTKLHKYNLLLSKGRFSGVKDDKIQSTLNGVKIFGFTSVLGKFVKFIPTGSQIALSTISSIL